MLAGLELGPVTVLTTEHRGFTPEEVAQRCLNRLIYVADDAPDAIRQQANAYRDFMYATLVHFMKEAIKSDRTTLVAQLTKQGHGDMAEIIRRL
jgi:hypothetical protein